MPRPCTICTHAERQAIDRATVEMQPFRRIAVQFGVSLSALLRHHDEHLPAALLEASRIAEVSRGDDLVERLLAVARETNAVLAQAKLSQDGELALKAIARVEKQIELQAKLVGQLKDAPVINLTLSPEWLSIQSVIINALDPFPDARLAVASALGSVQPHVVGSA